MTADASPCNEFQASKPTVCNDVIKADDFCNSHANRRNYIAQTTFVNKLCPFIRLTTFFAVTFLDLRSRKSIRPVLVFTFFSMKTKV